MGKLPRKISGYFLYSCKWTENATVSYLHLPFLRYHWSKSSNKLLSAWCPEHNHAEIFCNPCWSNTDLLVQRLYFAIVKLKWKWTSKTSSCMWWQDDLVLEAGSSAAAIVGYQRGDRNSFQASLPLAKPFGFGSSMIISGSIIFWNDVLWCTVDG